MVGPYHPEVLRFLNRVHSQPCTGGLDEIMRSAGVPRATARRWNRTTGLQFYPNIALTALGYSRMHLLIPGPFVRWLDFPYATEGAVALAPPGQELLYLHCLIPPAHSGRVRRFLRRHPQVVSMTTGDLQQILPDLQQSLTADGVIGKCTGGALQRSMSIRPIPAALPLLDACISELPRVGPRTPALWAAIKARLGEKVWTCLPGRGRKLNHNGKLYLTRLLRQMNECGIITGHVVRYAPLHERAVTVLIMTPDDDLARALATVAITIDAFPSTEGYLLRATGSDALLRTLISSRAITRWWFIDEERTKDLPPVRWQYERWIHGK